MRTATRNNLESLNCQGLPVLIIDAPVIRKYSDYGSIGVSYPLTRSTE